MYRQGRHSGSFACWCDCCRKRLAKAATGGGGIQNTLTWPNAEMLGCLKQIRCLSYGMQSYAIQLINLTTAQSIQFNQHFWVYCCSHRERPSGYAASPRDYHYLHSIKGCTSIRREKSSSLKSNMVSKKLESERIARSTAYHHKNGRRTFAQKAEDQKSLTGKEEQTLLAGIRTQLQATGCIHAGTVWIQATEIKRHRPPTRNGGTVTQQLKDPGKNWASNFLKAHCDELRIRNAKGLGWLMVITDFDRLCSNCASFRLRLETVLLRRPRKSRKIHTFQYLPGDIEEASCKLCNFVLTCAKYWSWPTTDKFSMHIHHMDSVLGPTLTESKILLSISTEDNSSKERHQGWVVPTLLESEANRIANPVWGHMEKTVDFDQIREWLMFCNQRHLNDCRMLKLDKISFFFLAYRLRNSFDHQSA